MRYKAARPQGGIREIAQQLNVDAVVEGSVLRAGDRVRITAQLIDARTDRHLWSERFDRDLRDVLSLQSDVAQAVAREIRIAVTSEERSRLRRPGQTNPEAHQAYLKGRYFWHKRTNEGLEKGIEYFRQAIEKDPAYALAYVGLADSYDIQTYHGLLPPMEGFSKAKDAARRALEIDYLLGEAHVAHGDALYRYDWDWPGAEKAFNRALELNPSDFRAHQWFGYFLISMGRVEEAIAEVMRGQAIEPLSPIATVAVGWVHFLARQYDRSIEECRKALELDPSFIWAHWCLGRALEQKGMHDQAIAEFQQARQAADIPPVLGALGHAYGVSGRKADALQVIRLLKDRGIQDYFFPYEIAAIHMGLNDKDQAIDWLRKAFEHHHPWLCYFAAEPMWDPLRSDPRFQDLLRRMNFPD
jgi:tetratricopeptide (TPR) repeat protein